MKLKLLVFFVFVLLVVSCGNKKKEGSTKVEVTKEVLLEQPKHGFLSSKPASRWEESAISRNGTLGILIPGDANIDRIVFSYEKLFMSQYPPYNSPNLGNILGDVRKLILYDIGAEASQIAVEEDIKVGISELAEGDFIWANPHIPACQLEVENLNPIEASEHGRSVNYKTVETTVAYADGNSSVKRKVFVSRKDGISVVKINSLDNNKLSYKFNLNQLPNTAEDFDPKAYLKDLKIKAEGEYLSYSTSFKIGREGSLKGYAVATKIIPTGGVLAADDKSII